MSKKSLVLRWEVAGQEAGQKLLVFLKSKMEASSNKELKKKIEANLCHVNDKTERFASALLRKGDRVTFFNEPLAKLPLLTFELKRVLFEDDHLLIYNKPVGFVCDKRSVDQLRKGLHLVHRLDKETTGVLIFAKDKANADLMQEQFHQRIIRKSYLALVDKPFKQNNGLIENYLGKISSYQGNSIYGAVTKDKGHLALTKWQAKVRGKKATLVLAQPVTGRTHQIRVHLAGLGHPILGDYTYGKNFFCNYRPPRILLHAYQVQFSHPVTNEKLAVIAPIPVDFAEAKKILIP
ncbi:hypothetical protein PHSC3_000520 [Chlamydiales bacterium STE3]|nr:hypothetical protein PHSC3_000520 [Chlamydiales bacterium STE3]